MIYKPCRDTLVKSILFDVSPMMTAVFVYFMSGALPLLAKVLLAASIPFSLFLLLSTWVVYGQWIKVTYAGIETRLTERIAWDEIESAILYERNSSIARPDHLLIIKSPYHKLMFNVSTLTEGDEQAVLAEVRAHKPLVIQQHQSVL